MKHKVITLWFLSIAAVVIVLLISIYELRLGGVLPVTQVVVRGVTAPKNQAEVKTIVTPLVAQESFVWIDINNIAHELHAVSWITGVQVSRAWPNKITIDVQTKQPVALWNDNEMLDRYAVVSPLYGSPSTSIPKLYGPEGSELKVMDFYQQFARVLSKIDVNIQQLYLEPDGDWQVVLNSGLKVMLSQQQALTRLRRFVKVYNKVFANKGKKAHSVDLRYPNGMAVDWGSN